MKHIILFLIALFVVNSCTLTERNNPFDPSAALTTPAASSFNVADHVSALGPNGVTLTWSRSTEPDFVFYVVCRSTSTFDIATQSLTSNELETLASEISAVRPTELQGLTTAQIASKMPTLASKFKAIAIQVGVNQNTFVDSGLTKNTGYFYAIASFLKNFKAYKGTATLKIETSPDIATARTMDMLWSFADIPGVVHEIDIDTGFSPPQMVISGYAWNLINYWGFSNRSIAYDYYVARIEIEEGFGDAQGYIYEPYCMVVSQHTNVNGRLKQIKGIVAMDGGSVYVPELAYPEWGFWWFSNTAPLTYQRPNSNVWYSNYQPVDDYTTYVAKHPTTRKLYVVGNDIDIIDADAQNLLDWISPPNSFKMRMNGIAFDSTGNVFVSDSERQKVFRYAAGVSGNNQTPTEICGGAGSKHGQFNGICDLAIDPSGNIYVSDTGNHRVQKFSSTGTFLSSYNLRDLGGNRMEGPRGLKYYNGKLYIGCTRSVVELVL